MSKQTIDTSVVGNIIHRISPSEIGETKHLGDVGRVVAAFISDGAPAFTVLYADGSTEELFLNHGGTTFLMAEEGAELDAMLEAFMIRQGGLYADDRAKYGYRAGLDDVVGFVLRRTGVELAEVQRVVGMAWPVIERSADKIRQEKARA